jgi:hypothetical protein
MDPTMDEHTVSIVISAVNSYAHFG